MEFPEQGGRQNVCVGGRGERGETRGSQASKGGACPVTENPGKERPEGALASLCLWETETLGRAETDPRSSGGTWLSDTRDLNSATLVPLSFPDTWLRGWRGHASSLSSATSPLLESED